MAAGSWLAGLLYDHLGYCAPAFTVGISANILNLFIVSVLVGRKRHHAVVYRTFLKSNSTACRTAASGAKRPFGEPTITLEAKAWLTSLSCRKAKELGYPHELETTRLLARHAREHGPAEGHPCLANTKMAVARVAAPDWSCAGSRGGGANPPHRASGCRRHTAGLVQGIEIGNTVNPKDDSFAINELICSTPRTTRRVLQTSQK